MYSMTSVLFIVLVALVPASSGKHLKDVQERDLETLRNSKREPGACERARTNSKSGLLGAFVPKCTADGTFEGKQCDGSTGYCWCVVPASGEEIEGSRKSSAEEVTCSAANGCFLCWRKKRDETYRDEAAKKQVGKIIAHGIANRLKKDVHSGYYDQLIAGAVNDVWTDLAKGAAGTAIDAIGSAWGKKRDEKHDTPTKEQVGKVIAQGIVNGLKKVHSDYYDDIVDGAVNDVWTDLAKGAAGTAIDAIGSAWGKKRDEKSDIPTKEQVGRVIAQGIVNGLKKVHSDYYDQIIDGGVNDPWSWGDLAKGAASTAIDVVGTSWGKKRDEKYHDAPTKEQVGKLIAGEIVHDLKEIHSDYYDQLIDGAPNDFWTDLVKGCTWCSTAVDAIGSAWGKKRDEKKR